MRKEKEKKSETGESLFKKSRQVKTLDTLVLSLTFSSSAVACSKAKLLYDAYPPAISSTLQFSDPSHRDGGLCDAAPRIWDRFNWVVIRSQRNYAPRFVHEISLN